MSDLEGIYRSAQSSKRREEVLERMRAGIDEKRIATDLGIERYSVAEIAQRLRDEGQLSGDGPPAR